MTTVDAAELLVDGPWRHRFVTANGSRFHVAEAGPEDRDAPLVLLLHGELGFWWSWRHQLPALADAGYRVAAMDLRGCGASDKPPSGYDTPTLVADASGVIRSLGADRAVLVGSGAGADVAWALPAYAPRLALAVAALACPRPATGDGRARRAARARSLRRLAHVQLPGLAERSLDRGRLAEDLLREWGGTRWPDPTTAHAYRAALQVPFAAHGQLEQLRWSVRSVPRADGRRFRAAMAHSRPVPVLQVHGRLDGLWSPAAAPLDADDALRFTTGYRYELLARCGHYPAEQSPEQVTALLLGWLDEVASARPRG